METVSATPAASALEVRDRLTEALELDLVGPWPGHELEREKLPGWVRPSNWYLTGFLIPVDAPDDESADDDADEEIDEVPESEGLPRRTRKSTHPRRRVSSPRPAGSARSSPPKQLHSRSASAGAITSTSALEKDGEADSGDGQRKAPVWRRIPRERKLEVRFGLRSELPVVIPVPESGGLELHMLVRAVASGELDGEIPPGTRSVSVFLVNNRKPASDRPDRGYVFQPELEVGCDVPFVPRPDLRGAHADDWDDRVSDLHYADTPEYATGHGIAADWELHEGGCLVLRTRWIPTAEVERTVAPGIDDVVLAMDALGDLDDGDAAAAALAAAGQRSTATGSHDAAGETAALSPARRRETAEELLRLAGVAADRIERGIAVLRDGPGRARCVPRRQSRRAPALCAAGWGSTDASVAAVPACVHPRQPAGRRRSPMIRTARPSTCCTSRPAAARPRRTWVWRRSRSCCGDCGTPRTAGERGQECSVVMRYTLRLLTLDQLSRAAGLVCALELEREDAPERYGDMAVRDRPVGRQGGDAERDGTQG